MEMVSEGIGSGLIQALPRDSSGGAEEDHEQLYPLSVLRLSV
jgi:hypothetical protein